jgi:hypothetical protein
LGQTVEGRFCWTARSEICLWLFFFLSFILASNFVKFLFIYLHLSFMYLTIIFVESDGPCKHWT